MVKSSGIFISIEKFGFDFTFWKTSVRHVKIKNKLMIIGLCVEFSKAFRLQILKGYHIDIQGFVSTDIFHNRNNLTFNIYSNIICPWKKWRKKADNVCLFPVHDIFQLGCPEGNSVCLSVCEMAWIKKNRDTYMLCIE